MGAIMNILSFDNNDMVDFVGTHLQGYVVADYTDIVEKFGEPTFVEGGDKTNSEWHLDFKVATEDGEDFDYVTAIIYDWKERETPVGKYRWHIGGHDYRAVEAVHEVMGV